MKFPDLKKLIDEHLALVPEGNVEMHVAEELAPKFLVVSEKIANMRMQMGIERTKYYSLQKACLKAATISALNDKPIDGKRGGPTADDRKKIVEADPEYLDATQAYEVLTVRMAYLSVMLDTFSNLHVFYRQVSKGVV